MNTKALVDSLIEPCYNCVYLNILTDKCDSNYDIKRAVLTGKCKKKEVKCEESQP